MYVRQHQSGCTQCLGSISALRWRFIGGFRNHQSHPLVLGAPINSIRITLEVINFHFQGPICSVYKMIIISNSIIPWHLQIGIFSDFQPLVQSLSKRVRVHVQRHQALHSVWPWSQVKAPHLRNCSSYQDKCKSPPSNYSWHRPQIPVYFGFFYRTFWHWFNKHLSC